MKPSNYIDQLHHLFIIIGGVFLVAMVLLTCANIVLRMVWLPVQGTVELMGFFGAIVTACALGYTQIKRGHIAVDVLINTFSRSTRNILQTINNLLCLSFFGLVAWQLLKKAEILRQSGEVTETLRIIYYPFMYVVAVGCVALVFVFSRELSQMISSKKKRISGKSVSTDNVYIPHEEMIEEI
ncbi:tripartite ATP-independent periplasmic transporter, DctQ component family protein [Candidatus Vecturithrix granuli]|uniref:Tripartite ATP-independent periplasmic transporter, DctQ component family protein n=1 Tax=Vecturithrix granuli TaxID=1499967 RepID=A0A081BYB8_VECG1|nr:tripartite ATP-independent periplasmic transporter, DctQ component family protein [Candidatus Vecturithrix granuli]